MHACTRNLFLYLFVFVTPRLTYLLFLSLSGSKLTTYVPPWIAPLVPPWIAPLLQPGLESLCLIVHTGNGIPKQSSASFGAWGRISGFMNTLSRSNRAFAPALDFLQAAIHLRILGELGFLWLNWLFCLGKFQGTSCVPDSLPQNTIGEGLSQWSTLWPQVYRLLGSDRTTYTYHPFPTH